MVTVNLSLLSAGNEPPPQQYKATPPRTPTREHRTDPRPGWSPHRIGFASPPPQAAPRPSAEADPSQLSQDASPPDQYVHHPLPSRYGKGDTDPAANVNSPKERNAFGTVKQTTGEDQGRRLVDAEPVAFHEFHPADYRTEGRVHLVNIHPLPEPPGQEAGPDLGVAEGGEHAAIAGRLPSRTAFF